VHQALKSKEEDSFMYTRSNGILECAVAVAFLWLIGCSTAQKKPEVVASSPQPSQAASRPEIQKAQSPTSLESLQQGNAPVTPKESPLKEIYFDFDKYDLQANARETLKTNAGWLSKNPAITVEIEGHCDERGNTEYNLALGAKRAEAAKNYLTTLGISPSRLSTISYGNEVPVCQEHNETCWQKNRRDRFVARTPKPGV
jgi:peptidoglycan-associated lipoprotein